MAIRFVGVDALDPDLVNSFAAGDGALWLGAGVSAAWNYDDAGTPLEPGVLPASALINRLLERGLHEDASREDLLDAGSRFVQAHGRPALDEIIRNWYTAEGVPAPRFYELLAQLPDEVATFITPNYDPFTEQSLSARRPVIVVKERRLDQRRAARPTVYKVHGDAQEPSGCVLTTRDYDNWEEDHPLLQGAIAEVFSHKTVVMVGYRARDRHFVRTLNHVARLIRRAEGAVRPLYVVMPRPVREDFAVFEEHGLEVVLIDATGDVFLENLLAALRAHRSATVLTRINDLIDAPEVWELRREIRRAGGKDGGEAELCRSAELRERLAGVLEVRARPSEGARERLAALEDLRAAGAAEDELAGVAAVLFEHVLAKRLDPVNVQAEAQTCMANRAYDGASVPNRLRLFLAAGRILARGAWADATRRMANRAEEIALDGDTFARCQTETAARLRAEAAMLDENFRDAAEFWRVAADAAESPDNASEFGIRAALCRGLTGDIDGVLDVLRGFDPTTGTRALHRRATAWLHALGGRIEEAADMFRAAAQASLEAEDLGFSVVALRNATWSEGQGAKWILREEPDLQRAYRVERMEGSRSGERGYDVETLLEDAYEALAFDRIRSAFVAGEKAAALALSDVDPLALEHARAVLAQVWVRSAELDPQPDDLFKSAWYTALSGALAPARSESSALDRTVRLLRDHGTAALVSEVVVELTGAAVGRLQKAGVLRLLKGIVDLIPEGLLELVVHQLVVGLRREWAVLMNVNQTGAALELAVAVAPRLGNAHVREVRDELLARLPESGPRGRDIVQALGFYLEIAPLADEPAGALAVKLIPWVAGDDYREVAAVRGCLGLIALSAESSLKERLLGVLVPPGEDADWRGRVWVWRAGQGPTPAEADRFLNEQAELLEQVLARKAVEGNVTRFFLNDVSPAIAEAVAPHATDEVRNRTLQFALRAAEHDELSRAERILWADFAAHLAAASEKLREPTVDLLVRIAAGASPPTRQIDPAAQHALSALRAQEAPVAAAQVRALRALGRIHASASEASCRQIEATLEQATRHTEPDVRESALRVIGIVVEDLTSDVDLHPLALACTASVTDKSADVRGAAYEALGRAWAAECASDDIKAEMRRTLTARGVEEQSAAARPFLERALSRLEAGHGGQDGAGGGRRVVETP